MSSKGSHDFVHALSQFFHQYYAVAATKSELIDIKRPENIILHTDWNFREPNWG